MALVVRPLAIRPYRGEVSSILKNLRDNKCIHPTSLLHRHRNIHIHHNHRNLSQNMPLLPTISERETSRLKCFFRHCHDLTQLKQIKVEQCIARLKRGK